MRSSREGKRAHSRFAARSLRETGGGDRKLIRFRRNRELLLREATGLLLWLALTVMMFLLARSMHRVAQVHLADQERWLRLALPALPLAGSVVTLWRAGLSLREWLDIRSEQRALVRQLQSDVEDSGDLP